MSKLKLIVTISCVLSFTLIFGQNTTPIWQSYYAGTGDNSDRYNKIVSDGTGNFIGVGYTVRSGNYRDFLVVKFDANGDTIWTHTKNGAGSGDDEAISAVVDASGNIFVCGYSDGLISNLDIMLIKYDAFGTKLFDTTWNSAAFLDDIPVAMALDLNGDVIVGGISEPNTISGSNNYITLKFSSALDSILWQSEFTRGLTGSKHELSGLVVDGSGDVYVTGRSSNGTDDDFATLKYSGIDGTQTWMQIYNSGNGNDRATALVLDNSGSVIVTGRSKNSNNDDFRTVKYSTAGILQWSKFYNAPANQDDRALAIAVDALDNVYVTGQSDVDNSTTINYDFATVKYSSLGTQQWSRITGSVFMQYDIPTAIKVDGSGNIFITGKSDQDPGINDNNDWMTVMYNTSGTLLWTQFKSGDNPGKGDTPASIILDASSNCYVVGSIEDTITQKNATVVKYDLAGTELVSKEYNGLGDFNEHAKAIVVDVNEITYTCGYSFHQDHNRDATILQTNAAGVITCMYSYNGIKQDDDEFNDLVLATNGSIYAVGYTKVSGQKSNFLIVKFDPSSCDTVWTRTYDYIGKSDKAELVAVDALGNIFVTGKSDSAVLDTASNNDIVTMKFDSNGNLLWTQRFDGTGNLRDEPSKILINGNGEILVCGRTENVHDDDFVILKYDATTGSPLWASPLIYNGPFSNDDRATDMTIDAANNIFVCGYSQTSSFPALEDPVIIKYDDLGNFSGFYSYSSVGSDEPMAIGHDQIGNVFVAIRTDVDPNTLVSNFNFLTMKFDNALNPLWLTPPQYDSPINQDDVPVDLIVSPAGDVYVTGTSENDSSAGRINQNWLTLFYDTQGNQLAIANHDGPNATDDAPNSIVLRGNSTWICGYVEGVSNAQKDNANLRYDLTAVGVKENSNLTESTVYPNPFNRHTTITLKNFNTKQKEIKISDLAGAIVAMKTFNGNSIEIQKENLASGMYQYSITENSTVISRGKFIIN